MLNDKGFDLWAGSYDEDISKFSKGYPFEGYYNVLGFIHSLVGEPEGKNILDIGVGTGLLSHEIYQQGAKIYGLDFSQKMIESAKIKMPMGRFYWGDIKKGIPEELNVMKFDCIVSSYAIHHISHEEKVHFINLLKKILKEDGKIIFGDIAFETMEDMEECRLQSGSQWDADEEYINFEIMEEMLKVTGLNYQYTQVSSCGGVLELWK